MKKLEKIFEKWWAVFLIYFFLSFILFAKILIENVLIYGTDWLLGTYTYKKWVSEFIKNYGRIPLWDPYARCGLPTVASFYMDILTPLTILRLIFPVHKVQVLGYIIYLSLGGLGTYLFSREWKLNPLSSFFAGLFYMFSGSLVTTVYGGHLGRSVSACIFPFMLFFLTRGTNKNNIVFFLIAGGFGGLAFLQGHFQLTYFAFALSVFYFYFYLIGVKKANLKEIIKFSIYAISGVLVSFMMYSFYIFPVLENLKHAARGAERGYEYSTSWSLPPIEILNLLYPHFSGYLENYWGESPFRLHLEYMGIVPFVLGLSSFIYFFKDKKIKFLIVWFIVVVFYALGGYTPVFHIFYTILPGVKKFRAPSLIFYQINFILAISSAFFISKFKEFKEKDLKIFIIISAGLLFLLALIFSVFKESFINLFSEFAKGDKENAVYTNYEFLLKDVWILFFLYLIFLTIIYLINFKKLSETLLLLFLPFFIFDVWRIEKDFIKSIEPPEIYYGEDEVIKFLKNDNDMYRVFPLRYKRADEGLLMLYGIESIGGYVANPLQRYQDFIGAEKSVMFVPINLINYKHLLNLLNVKYIIDIPLPPDIERYPENIKRQLIFWHEFYKDYEKVYSGKDYVIYKNPRDKGRIFFYGKWKILPQDEILKNLFLDKELSYIYIEEDKIKNIDFPPQKDSIEFSYKIKKYEADRIEFEYSLSHPAVCVLSINWHPKWRIRVDGKIVKSFPVNHTLTGFILPEGNHNVKLKFTSKGHKIGILLSFTGYLIFIISLITLIFIGKFKKKE